MKNRNIYLYIAGALACMMFGSLWNEFVAPHLKLETKATGLKPESCPLRSNGAERSERNPAPGRYYAVPKTAVESFPFDPNEADSTQLLRLGLTPAQVRSIYRHRAKGYVYSSPEDFARTPFMTKGQWNHLKPLIKIGDQYKPVNLNLESHLNLVLRASDGAERSERNPANSLSSVTSHLSTSRLSEGRPKLASGLPSDSDVCGEQPRIVNCPLSIINLNESSFKDLVHHPFLSYEQVKAVKNFQRKYGRIRNMTELLILPEFTVEDTLRLSPYLQF